MNSDKKGTSLKLNFVLNTFLQILNMIAPLLTAPYVSRVLGVEQIGVFSYTYSINYYFVMIAGLGTATYGVIEIAKHRDSVEARSQAFWGIELITIIASISCIVIWVGLSLLYKTYTDILLIMTLYLVAVILDVSWFFLGMERVQYSVLANAMFKIIGIVLTFAFVKKASDIGKYVCILSGTMMLGNASMWFFLPKFITKTKITVTDVWRHACGTMLYFIPTIASSVYMVLDKTLIGAITHSSSQNAYYEQATKIINLVKTITFTSLNTLLGSRMAYLFANNQTLEINSTRDFALEYVLTIGIGAAFGIGGISRIFVPIFFGEEFKLASDFLILMSPLIPIMGVSNLIGNLYYNPSGNRKKSTILLVICCLVNIILNMVLIPRYYGQGAIVASIIAESLITAMYIYYSRQFVTFSILVRLTWKKIIAGIIMLLYLIVVNHLINGTAVALAIQCGGGIVVYIAVLAALQDSSLRMIMENLCKTRKR